MPSPFSPATAEQVISVVDAVTALGTCTADSASEFLDSPKDRTAAALELAHALGLVRKDGKNWLRAGLLSRFVGSPLEERKAAVLRVSLESYEPFVTFQQRLEATASIDLAAQQTKAIHGITAHKDEVRDTLLSLGTYSRAIQTVGGGRYECSVSPMDEPLASLSDGCDEQTVAESRVRLQLGDEVYDSVDRDDVVIPLIDAIGRCARNDASGAVMAAGNAVESYLAALAQARGVNVTNRHGINAKVDELATHAGLPTKLKNVGKYLGHVRNAADHGSDPEINCAWTIRPQTGREYTSVALSFIATTHAHYNGQPGQI